MAPVTKVGRASEGGGGEARGVQRKGGQGGPPDPDAR